VRGEAGEDDDAVLVVGAGVAGLVERAGFRVEACGWFDRRLYAGGEDSV
jgi:hypothetical protein